MLLFYALNLFGVAVFAISGVLAAGRKSLDLLGVVVIAIVTAIGGGTIRDVLLDRQPIFWIQETENLLVILIASVITLIYLRFKRLAAERSLLIADALGLAVFTISGTQLSVAAGIDGPVAVIMGVITGVAGGVMRDVLTAEIPLILRRDLYATAAIAGGSLYLVLEAIHLPTPLPTVLGIAAVIMVRFAAIIWGLHLPVFKLSERSGTWK